MEGRRIENTLVALRRHLSGAVWITQKSACGDAREHADVESICSGLGSGRVPMDRARRRLHRLPPRGPPAPPGSASGLVCEGPSRGSSSPPPTTIFSPRTAPGSRCRPIEGDERKPWPQSGPQTAKGSPRTGLGRRRRQFMLHLQHTHLLGLREVGSSATRTMLKRSFVRQRGAALDAARTRELDKHQ